MTSGEIAELLQTLIRNACVNDGTPGSGHEERSVVTLRDYLGQPGLEFEPRPGRTSALWDLPAPDPTAPKLLMMGHLDVVPANQAGWSQDPFGGEIIDGFIWGRGAVDMLNQTAAMAAVFKRYLDGVQRPPAGGLAFLAVADEEAGGKWGAGYLTERHWDDVGCDYLLTEIAYPPIRTVNGPAYPVSVGEKGPFWRRLRSGGTPGHASQPYGTENALLPVARALSNLADAPLPVVITPEWRTFVEGLDLPDSEAVALTDPDLIDGAIEALFGDRPGFARYVHACTHLTVAPTVMRAGSKTNTIPDTALAEVDVRALPGQDARTVDEHLRKAIGADYERLEVEPIADFQATATAPAGPLWAAVAGAIEDLTGSRRILPTMMPATTDARFFRARGTMAYGVGLFDDRVDFDEFLGMFHGNDERVSLDSLGLTAEVLARTIAAL
ncbi:MAG TPA: M20/M25/M40 family metallo-hydrolase [Acidimicrobiia bacterium]|nr:M20/M25/M40 family metallo-hydrolase [Acidimicrobiia bacterium]